MFFMVKIVGAGVGLVRSCYLLVMENFLSAIVGDIMLIVFFVDLLAIEVLCCF